MERVTRRLVPYPCLVFCIIGVEAHLLTCDRQLLLCGQVVTRVLSLSTDYRRDRKPHNELKLNITNQWVNRLTVEERPRNKNPTTTETQKRLTREARVPSE